MLKYWCYMASFVSGGSGCRAGPGAIRSRGIGSIGCCGVTRCRRRLWSTRCTVKQRSLGLTSRMP